jgi:hypothetical protein
MKPARIELLADIAACVAILIALAIGALLCREYGAAPMTTATPMRSPVAFVSGGWNPKGRRLSGPLTDLV